MGFKRIYELKDKHNTIVISQEMETLDIVEVEIDQDCTKQLTRDEAWDLGQFLCDWAKGGV